MTTVQDDASVVAARSVGQPGAAAPGPTTRRRRSRVGIRPPKWFVLPALVAYLVVVVVPNLQGFGYSFTTWDGLSPEFEWVGLDNFARVFDDRSSYGAMVNTVLLTLAVVVVQNVLGLLLALGLNTTVKSRYLLRLVFFLPVVLTAIVTGYLWTYLLNPRGTVNQILGALGLEGAQQDWLGDPGVSLWAVAAAIVWQGVGITMVIYLAALQNVPAELVEAAKIDGAGSFRRLMAIVLPLINGAVVINLMLTITGTLKQFDMVYAMTGGGPAGATETISTVIYKNAFTLLDFPLAIAQGVLLTLVVAVIAIAQIRLTRREI
ncbi:ABC transporter permease subunit [Auraticoccus sp. F435]|uniref:ABC transporter permease subunit n=1 Tax=Auraticoccus cholistanensis TaxID=2656650 RepID=A0A6A9UU27_9ACTN|nr:sugar ABC transporter permease [Auraticoccus cholistanensis]MVA74707.1 ABC transporter permease subunit [Auraticoccus cholistanensis]